MRLASPYPQCSILLQDGHLLRADVGDGRQDEVLECYRTLAVLALEHKLTRVLVVGKASGNALSHLAARDAVIALADCGVAAGFKIAFAALTHETLNAYLHAQIAATDRGIRAKVFRGEEEALRWIREAEQH